MNLQVALGAMRLVADLGYAGFLEGAGVAKGEFQRLVSALPWTQRERNRMTVVLQSCLHGSVDSQGLPRFPLPAEYIAAGISIFVHAMNHHAACIYMASAPDAEDLARNSDMVQKNRTKHVMPDQLYSMVCLLNTQGERGMFRALFEKNSGLALESVSMESVEKGSKR